jgi:hypothetical protein
MPRQLHFSIQHIQILLFEVAFNRIANKQAKQEQHKGRGQCEQQCQTESQ